MRRCNPTTRIQQATPNTYNAIYQTNQRLPIEKCAVRASQKPLSGWNTTVVAVNSQSAITT